MIHVYDTWRGQGSGGLELERIISVEVNYMRERGSGIGDEEEIFNFFPTETFIIYSCTCIMYMWGGNGAALNRV